MILHGLTVGRNEEHRYLRHMLQNAQGVVDTHFFYDDQSLDCTASVAASVGCGVVVRPVTVPSFSENEGAFRGAAWEAFERMMCPQTGDWVLVIDCDEFIATSVEKGCPAISRVLEEQRLAIDLQIPEVFGFELDGWPVVRTDKLWGTIHAPRLFRYREGGSYFLGALGVPAVPTYVMANSWGQTEHIAIVHFGYAKWEDRRSKYNRYTGQAGHSNDHVESILDDVIESTRCKWQGQVPWKQLTS